MTYLRGELGRAERALNTAEEPLAARRRRPAGPPAWLIERGIGAGRLTVRVHAGTCWDARKRCTAISTDGAAPGPGRTCTRVPVLPAGPVAEVEVTGNVRALGPRAPDTLRVRTRGRGPRTGGLPHPRRSSRRGGGRGGAGGGGRGRDGSGSGGGAAGGPRPGRGPVGPVDATAGPDR
ncbi:DUF6233 domain-containing protein [Streptomyces sp. NBC_00868]|uniref:DUF6233 domain-containing protein n=1 Tax=Streptomyces sp. NBC_00868 TaxID=2903683 RepID=UPI0038688199